MARVDPRARFLLELAEQQDSVLPSDASGYLADPTVPAGVTRPPVTEGTITGFGRDFVRASAHWLVRARQSRLLRAWSRVAR